jgi:hypothetical protein
MKTSATPAVIDAHLSDRDCLDLATTIVLRHPQRRIEFQNLVRERGWDEAAMVAAYDCQARSMRLRWWEQPRAWPASAAKIGPPGCCRMARRGISRYHPNPLAAIAAAGAATPLQHDQAPRLRGTADAAHEYGSSIRCAHLEASPSRARLAQESGGTLLG